MRFIPEIETQIKQTDMGKHIRTHRIPATSSQRMCNFMQGCPEDLRLFSKGIECETCVGNLTFQELSIKVKGKVPLVRELVRALKIYEVLVK